MAVGGRCSGGRGVCEPMATLGCDWHAVNDTILAHGQLLVDDPERIGPIQATGKDQTLFNRLGQYRTQQWATTFDSPLKSEGPFLTSPLRWGSQWTAGDGQDPSTEIPLVILLVPHRGVSRSAGDRATGVSVWASD